MKKRTMLISVLLLVFLVGCGENASNEDSSGDNVVKVGATPDGYPHSFQEDGELKGFGVDVIEAIFEGMDYEVEWVLTDWNGVLANLESGKVDSAFNFALTPERAENYNFADPYYNSKAAVATAKDDGNIESLNDLEGKKLASVMGTNFENVLKEHYPDENYELVIYEAVDVIYTDVSSGKVDGFIYGREQLMAQISQRDIPLEIVDESFGEQPVALPFKESEENDALIVEINESIEELKEDGTFSEISLKWFEVDLLED